MDAEQALNRISRYTPCPHGSHDASIGDGKTWARCHDCGNRFPQEHLKYAQEAHQQFEAAIALLDSLLVAKKQPTQYSDSA